MENWLEEQINQIASQWAGAIKKHYPESYPYWSDADLQMELLGKHFLPALDCLEWPKYTASPGLRVLDLGAGTGWLSAFLSTFPNVEQIDTLDSDRHNLEVMLPQIIERMGGDAAKIHPILGLFSPLLVPDQQYELIVASSSIHHAPDLFDIMRELRRVIKPGGTIILLNELPRTFDGYIEYMLHLFYLMLGRVTKKSMTEYEEKISASGILYDPKLGDIAYAFYQYGMAINSAGLDYTVVDTGQKINELPLMHFICYPKSDIGSFAITDNNSSVITNQNTFDISKKSRVTQIMRMIVGDINIDSMESQIQSMESQIQSMESQIQSMESQIRSMESSKFWKLRKIWMKVKQKLGLTIE